MLQVATFTLPDQQEAANEFLRTHRPEGPINFNTNMIVIFYETGEVPALYQIGELEELARAAKAAKFQMEVALHIMQYEIADLHTNQKGYDELQAGIRETQRKIHIQDQKVAFVEKRIADLKSGNGTA